MSTSNRASSARLARALISGLLLVTVAGGGVLAQSPVPEPPTIVSDAGATPAVPNPAVTGAQPVPFERIDVGPDGRTLTIYYWHGVDGCYGLKEVTVAPVDGGYAITIWAGMLPEAVSRTCVSMAQLYSTQVVLDAPVFINGGLD